MRLVSLALMVGLLAAPVVAQTPAPASDTIKAMIEKGITMSVMGFQGDMTYAKDGKYSGFDGMATGTYTVDGSKMCTTSDMGTLCVTYPDGKKSGDTFTVNFEPIGDVSITIK